MMAVWLFIRNLILLKNSITSGGGRMTDKQKKLMEITRLVGTIQDLAKDIEQDATGILVYKDKLMHLSEVRDGAYAIIKYSWDLEKLLIGRGEVAE